MKTKIFTLLLMLFVIFEVQSQINFDFKSGTSLDYWSGGQSELSITENEYLCLKVTGSYWATAGYAYYKNWDFDNNKVVVVKVKEKKGDLALKIQVDGNSERVLRDSKPTTVPSSTNVIHMFAFEDNSSYTELQSGTSKVNNIQFATEGVNASSNDSIKIDWIKTFATKAEANAYIADLSKLDNEFSTIGNLTNWSGSLATLSQSNSNMVITMTSGYGYGIATYAPPGFGLSWNMDLQKAFVVKISNTGNFAVKFRSNALNKDYLYTCATPVSIPNSSDELQVFAFEDQAATYPELTGVVKFDNMQLAYEGINNGDIINIDYIKTFATKADANAYVTSYITPTITFSTPTVVNKTLGESSFTNVATSNSAGTIIYSSGTTSVATVNSTTGEVTIVDAGLSIITASQTANGNYNAAIQTYTLNVAARPVISISGYQTASALTNPIANISVPANSELTIDATSTVHNITIESGGKVTLNDNVTLNLNNLNINSDASGTGTFVDKSTTGLTFSGKVQQYVTEGRNWYMSIPLASCASSLLSRGTSVICYDEPSGNWIAPAAGTLNKMRGYVQTATTAPLTGSTGTVDFTGVVNTGAQSISLTRTAGKTGFNLVGNPYPSYLDWNAVIKTNVSNTLWYRTKEGGVYKFYTYVANSGSGVGSPVAVTNKIPPMQAFWVRVNTEGTGSIAMDNSMRFHNDVGGNIMKAPKQTTQQLLRLQVSNGTNTDETVLYFNTNASDAFDSYDAQKRSNDEPSIPEIFTQAGTEKLVINGMSQVKYNTEIPIGFSTGQANDFSISANEISNFENGTHVILIDKLFPTVENDITNGTAYSFNALVTVPTTNRFSLLFRAPSVSTGVDNANKLNAQVFVNANNQITIIAPEKATYSIYNTVGILLENGVLNYKLHTINCKLNSGVYFVQLSANSQSEIQKVIIR